MTLVCPACGRRYRVDEQRLGTPGRKVRCSGCGTVFLAGRATEGAAATSTPAAAPRMESVPARGREARAPAASNAESPLALVADEDREFRDLVARTLVSLGCRVETTDDGESAFRFAVARRPTLMIVNVYLRRLLGVAVCEGVKGSPDLRGTRVALVGSVFKSDRFVRSPGNLYGADDYFEDVIPRDELRVRLARLIGSPGAGQGLSGGEKGALPKRTAAAGGLPMTGRPAGLAAGLEEDELSGAGLAARLDAAFDEIGAGAAVSPPGDPSLAPIEPRAEIRRLARIMLSDLKIYHPADFQRAVVDRRFFETFREEMMKGKDLIAHRFPDLPERIEVLAAALREGLEEERRQSAAKPAGTQA